MSTIGPCRAAYVDRPSPDHRALPAAGWRRQERRICHYGHCLHNSAAERYIAGQEPSWRAYCLCHLPGFLVWIVGPGVVAWQIPQPAAPVGFGPEMGG